MLSRCRLSRATAPLKHFLSFYILFLITLLALTSFLFCSLICTCMYSYYASLFYMWSSLGFPECFHNQSYITFYQTSSSLARPLPLFLIKSPFYSFLNSGEQCHQPIHKSNPQHIHSMHTKQTSSIDFNLFPQLAYNFDPLCLPYLLKILINHGSLLILWQAH